MEITMSVHEALAKLKTYNKRVNMVGFDSYGSATKFPQVIGVKRNSDTTVCGLSVEDFEKRAKAELASVNALYSNISKIKAAIVISNATTKVTVCGKEYTVASAIENKNIVTKQMEFLNVLKNQLNREMNSFQTKTEKAQDEFEKFLNSYSGGKDKMKVEEVDELQKKFNEKNGPKLIDPLHLAEYISKKQEEYENFLTEIDFRLSESNAITKITVNLDD